MQEWLNELLHQYSGMAPLIIFLGLVIAAFNIPISEDLTVIAAGIFVANVAPQEFWFMYFALIFGAIGGDILAYGISRKVGRSLLEKRFFRRILSEQKLELLSRHFEYHAILTILLGRLIPFGVRNGISLLAGITRLPVWKFVLFNTISGVFSISVIYLLSWYYGDKLLKDIRTLQVLLLLLFLSIITYIIYQFWQLYHKKRKGVGTET